MERTPSRRRLLAAAGASAVALAGCGSAPEAGTDSDGATDGGTTDGGTTTSARSRSLPDEVGLETLVSGLQAPVDLAFLPGADRRYVATQGGRLHVHGPDGLRDEPALDLSGRIEVGGEKGLLGIALHPDFAENRRLFVRYSAPPRSGTPDGYSHTFVLASFRARADGPAVRPDSERTVLEIPEPQSNHNAGDVAFGPEGHLYVAVGDGGAGGDQGRGHVDDWYGAVGGGNGQDVRENLLGSILRIDVDAGDRGEYGTPDDNPLVGRPGLDEHYAWGLRNPWRMSFDRGRLFVGDVGQNSYEEIDLVEKGGNYGWNVREGTHCYAAESCPDATPNSVRGGEPLIDPIVEYPHSGDGVSGISVIGGVVYRGSAMPDLDGAYVFGDLSADGRLFVATPPAAGRRWPASVLPVADGDAGKLGRILSFARHDGEAYALGVGDEGGGVHRIVPAG